MLGMMRPATYRARFLTIVFVVIFYFIYTVTSPSGSSSSSSSGTRVGIFGHGRTRYGKPIQYDFKGQKVTAGDKAKADQIKHTMSRTFWKYKLSAWGFDEINPISGYGKTTRNGWAATIVDTLTTTAIMNMEEEFKLELNYTLHIDFNKADGLVDPFETTIRYLGAIVSAIELIDAGVVRKGLVSESERNSLLSQAESLASRLGPGFDSPTGMIWPRINFTTSKGCTRAEGPGSDDGHAVVEPARAGTNWLEYTVLSKLTRDDIYEKNATRAWKNLVWNQYVEDWPGLVDSPVDIITGTPVGKDRSWDRGHDSYYEYLIKAHILAPKNQHSKKYGERWVEAVESTMKHLALWSTPGRGHEKGNLFLAQWKGGFLANEMSHLSCFAGGNFLLGGKYLDRPDIVQFGLEVVDACHETYVNSITRIGPESFAWTPADKRGTAFYEPEHSGQREQRKNAGFWVTDARYMLRPETVESYFYAYRTTGNKMYQDWAWDAYRAIMQTAKAEYGYAEVKDVTLSQGGGLTDQAESFWGGTSIISLDHLALRGLSNM